VGKAITLDDSLYTVVGVLPSSLAWPLIGAAPRDVWLPLDLRDDKAGMMVIGRMRPGTNAETAARELDSLSARSGGDTGGRNPFQAVVMPPSRRLQYRDSLIMLSYAVGLVLLIACANVAHLLMARSASRHRELAIRAALGAGRGRVFRQLLTESLLLAVGGTVAGVAVGWLGLKALIALRPPSLDTLARAHLDGTTLGIATCVAIATGVSFGLLGALQSRRRSPNDSLRTAGARVTSGRARARTLLVVSEMALSATLIVGATMLVRSVSNMQHAKLGFEPAGLYTLTPSGTKQRYATRVAKGDLLRAIATRLAAMPGIKSVALASTPPTWRSFVVGRFEVDGETPPPENETAFVDINQIGSSFFQTMGMHLVQGTMFTDTTADANQIIVNAGFARKHWGAASAVGHRVRVAQNGEKRPWRTIVGVANDASTLGPMAESTQPLIYSAAADSAVVSIIVRTEGSASSLTPIKALVRSVDAGLRPEITSVEREMSATVAAPRFVMLLLSVFTVLALLLAAIGLYGVMAYTVAEQTREIGIRVALGATRSRIARAIVMGSAAVAVLGAAVGMATAAWGTKLIEHQLFGVERSDVVSFIAPIVVLLGAAAVACIVPTRRALAVDPMTAIRAD
jgi:putative ABC transport system permease protein